MNVYPFLESAVWSGVVWFMVAYVVTIKDRKVGDTARLVGVGLTGCVGGGLSWVVGWLTNIPATFAILPVLVAVLIGEIYRSRSAR